MRGRIGRRDLVSMATLGLAGIGIPLWMAAAAGTIGLPGNDDWIYMRAASSLFRTGNIDMPGHTAASVGQLALVQPLLWLSGGDPCAFTAFGLGMALLGLTSTYLLARRFVGAGSAILVVLLVEAFPGFARTTAGFMTDIPAYSLAVLSLLLGTRWLQGDGRRVTLVASLAVGLLAFSIREFAIAAPLAILLAAWARNRPDERVWLTCLSGLLAVGVAGVLLVAASIPGYGVPRAPDLGRLSFIGSAFATLAAVLLPAAALAMGRRMAGFSAAHIVLGAGVIGAGLFCLVLVFPYGPIVGNYWMPNGLGGDAFLSGTRDFVIGANAWDLSAEVAWFAAILVAALAFGWGQRNLARVTSWPTTKAAAIRVARSREAPLGFFLVGYAAAIVFFTSISYPLDRYLYPMVPAAAILLLQEAAQPSRFGMSRALAQAAFAWLVASAVIIAANSFAYDAARWRAGDEAVAMGYDARTVDAGYEWVGYHASGARSGSGTYGLSWYDDVFLAHRPCAVVSNSPLNIGALRLIRVDRAAYLQYLFFGPAEPLYLYGSLADGCPPPPAAVAATAS
jgi:4-amino-4-deoxy-L-arabinose transferase-like glycosyltransferase